MSVHHVEKGMVGGELAGFRQEFYRCMSRRADALFELADVVLCADGPVRSLPELSLVDEHRRGHGGLYAGLARGRLDTDRLRRALAAGPLPRAADGCLVLAVDITCWLRPEAHTSPQRILRRQLDDEPVLGLAFAVVAAILIVLVAVWPGGRERQLHRVVSRCCGVRNNGRQMCIVGSCVMNEPVAPGVHNAVFGIADTVMQARDIYGGVHVQRTAVGRQLPIPRQLPGEVWGFVGRQVDLEQLDAVLDGREAGQLRSSVISTVAGTAGVGKTALAVHWAHRVRERFSDGQLYLNLCGYDPEMIVRPEQALHGFLQALDVPVEKIPRDLAAQAALYRSLLEGRHMLILLDNAASADQVRPLLPGAAGCLVLITSRGRMSSLVAREGAHRVDLDLLPDVDAKALLRTIIGAERADAEPDAIADLTRLCARLPLALRIAAERATHPSGRSLAAFVEELTDLHSRLDALATNDGEETTAVRAVFSWSYRALSGEEAQMFRLLGLHPGPQVGLGAAAALAAVPAGGVRRLLDKLAAVHLLEQLDPERFRFHDLLRAYAADVARHDESAHACRDALRRVLDWYLHSAAAAMRSLNPHRSHGTLDQPVEGCTPLIFSTPDQALRWCEMERDNLVAAVHVAASTGERVIAWKLPIVLWSFFDLRKHWSDWIDTHRVGLAAAQQLGDRHGVAWVTDHLGIAYFDLRQVDQAMRLFHDALAIRRDIGDRRGEASTLNHLGTAHRSQRQLDAALECGQQALAIRRDLGDRRGVGHVLNSLSATYRYMGQLDSALDCAQQALAIRRDIGDRYGEAWALNSLANVLLALDRADEAIALYGQALTIRRDISDRRGEAESLFCLGNAQHRAGHANQADISLRQAMTIFDELGSPQADDVRAQIDVTEID